MGLPPGEIVLCSDYNSYQRQSFFQKSVHKYLGYITTQGTIPDFTRVGATLNLVFWNLADTDFLAVLRDVNPERFISGGLVWHDEYFLAKLRIKDRAIQVAIKTVLRYYPK
jgi:hypothetical protein